jgi:hypothetical protein
MIYYYNFIQALYEIILCGYEHCGIRNTWRFCREMWQYNQNHAIIAARMHESLQVKPHCGYLKNSLIIHEENTKIQKLYIR